MSFLSKIISGVFYRTNDKQENIGSDFLYIEDPDAFCTSLEDTAHVTFIRDVLKIQSETLSLASPPAFKEADDFRKASFKKIEIERSNNGKEWLIPFVAQNNGVNELAVARLPIKKSSRKKTNQELGVAYLNASEEGGHTLLLGQETVIPAFVYN